MEAQLMTMDWKAHKAHRQQVIKDFGYWIGLTDENWEPIMDLPRPKEPNFPRTRLSPESSKATFNVQSATGVIHPVFTDLVGQDLGRVDKQGVLIPHKGPSRFIVVEKADAARRAYKVAFTEQWSPNVFQPQEITIHGNDLLRILSGIVAMTAPTTWSGHFTTFTRDWAGPSNLETTFSKPRDLQPITMVTTADGASIEGPAAELLRELTRVSTTAQFRATGRQELVDNPPIQVEEAPADEPLSPTTAIRLVDNDLLDTITPTAQDAGIDIHPWLWWPEDPQPRGLTLTLPTIVTTITQQEVN